MSENKEKQGVENEMEMISEEDDGEEEARIKIKKLREKLEKCNEERKEYLDGWQRARAELSNYKKDEAKRFEEFMKFAAEGIISEVVQVLDSFDLALRYEMPKEVEKGIVLIRSQLEDILRRRGLELISSLGRKFDPMLHESMGEVETDEPEGVIVEELQKGYMLNGKLIRPARVKVSKTKMKLENA